MKLLTIKTQNFKRLKDFTCSFTDGLNTIIGDNAAGKSTLLHAVITALYGAASIPGKVDDMPTWGQKSYKIELEFLHDDRTYLVARDSRNSTIKEGDRLIASGNSNCTKFIEELLGLTFKDFTLFVLSQQGETAGVLTFGATALQKRVEAFSGADIIDAVLVLVRGEMTVLSRTMQDLNPSELEAAIITHTATLETTQGQLEEQHVTLEKLTNDKETKTAELVTARSTLKKLIHVSHTLQSKKQAFEHVSIQLASAETAVLQALEVKKQLPEAVDVDYLTDQITSLETSMGINKANISAINRQQREYLSLTDKVERLEQQIATASTYEMEAAKLTLQVAPLNEQLESLQPQLTEARHAVKQLKKEMGDGVCFACSRPFDDHDPAAMQTHIDEAERVVLTVASQVKQLQDQIAPMEKALRKAENAASAKPSEEFAVLSKTLAELEEVIDTFSDEVLETAEEEQVKVRVSIENLRSELSEFRANVAKHRKADSQVENLTSEMATIREQFDLAQEHLQVAEQMALEANPDQLDDTEVRCQQEILISSTEDFLTLIGSRIAASKDLIGDLGYQVKTANKDLELVKKELRRVLEVAVELDKHKRLAKFLAESRNSYLKQIWDQILGVASAKVAISTQGRITRLHRDEKGEFVAEEEGKWVPIANCSGAQKAFIGVAMRVGLSSCLYGTTGLLILDEPTDAMNDASALNLAGSLMGLGGQCLMITHRSYEQLAAQNVVQVK